MLRLKASVLLLLTMLFSTFVQANGESMQQFGDYQVHYSVLNTSFISPEIAQHYNIVRSKNTAMMNIAVLKKQDDGSYRNVTALVTGEHNDLVRKEPLNFTQVREEHAIYYLATFTIHHKIDVYFTVNVQPDPNKPAFKLQWSKRLYRDE